MSLKQNIKKYRLNNELTLDELSEKIGIKKSTLQRYESGVIANIPSDKIEKMAEVFGIKPSVLMGWDSDENSLALKTSTAINTEKLITVYGKVCAGNGLEAFEDRITEIINPYPNLKGDLFALQVEGDSMNNVVANGMYAIIKRQPTVNNGEIAVVLIDHQTGMLKRFSQHDDVVILRPDSTNSSYQPLPFIGEEINKLKIIGKYIGHVSPMIGD